jgi:hypothetical protein
VNRATIEGSELCLEDIGILETKAETTHTEIAADSLPACLVDPDINRPERNRYGL